MDEFIKLLEKFENLIYKVLVWIVLIPKTLLQIVLHPEWAGDYIKQELGEGARSSMSIFLRLYCCCWSLLYRFCCGVSCLIQA